jgi:branched-chain amino acid transport system substrate-binding protein
MRPHLGRASGFAALCACALAACGSNPSSVFPIKHTKPRPTNDSRTVRIYSSLPLYGPLRGESLAIMKGINLALNETKHRVLNYSIEYNRTDALNDATRKHHPDLLLAQQNAEKAARDPQAVFYIGDLDTAATKVSLPILNQAGIVQVTPGSAYAGLTDNVPGVTRPREPLKYYPIRDSRTLLRLVPSDVVEAAAGLQALQTYSGGCKDFGAAAFGPADDAGPLIKAFEVQAKDYGLKHLVVRAVPGKTATSMSAYAEAIAHAGAGCFVFTGHVTPAAVALTREIHTVLPKAMILGSSGFCNPSWTDQRRHGPPSNIGTYLYCTSAQLPVNLYPDTAGFRTEYRQVYGRTAKPNAFVLYGYEAAEMADLAIEGLGGVEDDRTVVRNALLGGGPRDAAVLGSSVFDSNGDTSWHTFGLYRPGNNGNPKLYHTVRPKYVL